MIRVATGDARRRPAASGDAAAPARRAAPFSEMQPARLLAEASISGHFGELLQGRLGPGGPLVLVTLPAPDLRVTARLLAGPFGVHCCGAGRCLGRRQAAALFRAVTGLPPAGRLLLRSAAPAGGGAGSSTAALLAAAAVYATAHERAAPPPDRLAQLSLELEGATDPLMHSHPDRLLWAPREGRTLAVLPPLPGLSVVGGFLGPGRRTDPADLDFPDIADLATAWPAAAARGDLAALARIATESATRTVRRRGGPPLEPMLAAGVRLGALGAVAAHTGSARGLIFPPRADTRAAVAELRALGLRQVRDFRLAEPTRAG